MLDRIVVWRLIDHSDNGNSQCLELPQNNRLRVFQHIVITEPDDLQSGDGFQVILPSTVKFAAVVVTPAIELNDQAVGMTIEIDDVRADAVLAAEFDACQAVVAKQAPEDSLGNR